MMSQYCGYMPSTTSLAVSVCRDIASNLDVAKKNGQCCGYLLSVTSLAIFISHDIASRSRSGVYV